MSLLTDEFWEAVDGQLASMPATDISIQQLLTSSVEAYETGDFCRAMLLSGACWRLTDQVLGHEHTDTLNSMSNLASTLRARGDLASAELMHREVLEIRRRVLGPEHPDTLTSMNNLALALQACGDLAGAEAFQREELDLCRSVLGPEHPDTLISMSNLSESLRARGDLAGAEKTLRQVLDIQQRVLGPEHPDTLNSMNNLGLTLWARDDLTGAESMQREALEIRSRVLGPEHPRTLTSMNNLALTLGSRGDYTAAETIQREVLDIRRRLQGPQHPHTVKSINNLAETLRAHGDCAVAEEMHREALEVFRRVLGPEHPDTLFSMNNLAGMLRVRGDLPGAEEAACLLGAASEIIDRMRGSAGDDIARALRAGSMHAGPLNVNLATLHARLGGPVEDVLLALERGGGRVALDIMDRAGRGALELARERLSPDRLQAYVAADQRHTELRFQRDVIQQQILRIHAEAGAIRDSDQVRPGRADSILQRLDLQLNNLSTELNKVTTNVESISHEQRVIDQEILPVSRIRGLDEVLATIHPGEVLVTFGYSRQSSVAVVIPHGDEASAVVLSENQELIAYLNAVSALISMGVSPDPSLISHVWSALNLIKSNSNFVPRLSDQMLKDIEKHINDLEKARQDRQRPLPSLSFETLGILSRELLRVLLPAPVRTAMAKSERIVVVPSGPLHELPLSLLIEAAGIEELTGKPIIYTPSASILTLQRQTEDPEGEGLSIAGDAFFGEEDTADDLCLVGAVRMRDLRNGHNRLPRTRSEAEQIEALFKKAGQSKTDLLLDAAASVSNVRTKAPSRRFVHLASHAILGGADNPMSSAVVLAKPNQSTAEDTGYLTLEELITHWGGKLRGCLQVTLSACQSSVSVELGDSRMALPLGLLHAGAKCVLASLWPVPDIPTWLLMRRFYENMLGVRHNEVETEPRTAHSCVFEAGTPMPATAALTEAQQWIREMTLKQLESEIDELDDVTVCESKLLACYRMNGDRYPFEPVINWGAFVIVGECN